MLSSIATPWILMSFSTWHLLTTVANLTAAGDLGTLLSWEALKDAWFGSFWAFQGPRSKSQAEPWVVPLLEGRVKGGRAYETASSPPIQGIVLEIGAGSGMWTEILANTCRAANSASGMIPSKIYGVEPNPISAAALTRRVAEVGLTGMYEVLPFGIEHVQKETSIGPGSVDCIVTIKCLCSIPEPDKNIRLLYEYLKPGGRWFVYEHVKAERGLAIPLLQRFTNVFWEHLMGSCQLCRPTLQSLVKTGDWENMDLTTQSNESSFEMLPHIVGTLTKSS
ncbi:hypothetical protein FZEAL_5074 [Fusarium zealandicum]|uniref:Methyltransferase-like protein 7B n=1 Tax=Fusarium zealandicum TaxID=1053134 RepID=A0A8H4UKX3_9HYPO|nr:hypothetical protein FZEAL_5074 [Fusarium zealandicum]